MTRAWPFALIALLAVLHQDFWFWDDPTVVAGFLPIGLAWHVGISLAATACWLVVVQVAWPEERS